MNRYAHIPSSYLKHAFAQLIIDKGPLPGNAMTLLGQNDHALTKYNNDMDFEKCELDMVTKMDQSYAFPNDISTGRKLGSFSHHLRSKHLQCNGTRVLLEREIGVKLPLKFQKPLNVYNNVSLYKRIQGHFSAAYCIIFDRTSSLIITGSDDRLIKIWSAKTGYLISTLRGHVGDITSLSIDFKNRILASSSNDYTIRLWSLSTFESLAVLVNAHSEPVTEMNFSPDPSDECLISTALDGFIKVWRFQQLEEGTSQLSWTVESISTPSGITCASVSPGGTRIATGHADGNINIWSIKPLSLIQTLRKHTADVNSLSWSHSQNKLLSGTNDGLAVVWVFNQTQGWLPDITLSVHEAGTRQAPKVSTALWSLEDDYIISTTSRCQNNARLRVWDARNGQLVHRLMEHSKEIFVIDIHPTDPRVFVSAGYDGKIIVWDIETGFPLYQDNCNRYNEDHDISHFDGRYSRDGTLFACIDNDGSFWIYGLGKGSQFDKAPVQQFFHNELVPLIQDSNGFVVDSEHNVPPHLLPRGTLCNIYLHPYFDQPSVPTMEEGNGYSQDDYNYHFQDRMYHWKNEESTICSFVYIPEPESEIVIEEHAVQTPQVVESSSDSQSSDEDMDISDEENFEPSQHIDPEDDPLEDDYLSPSSIDDDEEEDDESFSSVRRSSYRTRGNVQATPYFSESEQSGSLLSSDEELSTPPRKRRVVSRVSNNNSRRSAVIDDDDSDELQLESPSTPAPPKKRQQKYTYPFWMHLTKHSIAYVPQLNDRVVYFKKGHKVYAKKLAKHFKDEVPDIVPDMAFCEIIQLIVSNIPFTHFEVQLRTFIGRKIDNSAEEDLHGGNSDESEEFDIEDDVDIEEDDLLVDDSYDDDEVMFDDFVEDSDSEEEFTVGKSTRRQRQLRFSKRSANQGKKKSARSIRSRLRTETREKRPPVPAFQIDKDGYLTFSVHFHPCATQSPDFLVLESRFNQAIKVSWYTEKKVTSWMYHQGKEGMEGLGDWYQGLVVNYPDSFDRAEDVWEGISIVWKDGFDETKVSPWELEELDEEDRIMPVSVEAIDPDISQEIKESIERDVLSLPESLAFREPVSLEEYPEYALFVPNPIDLRTILERLKNNYYRNLAHLIRDVEGIKLNALLFNEETSSIVEAANTIVAQALDIINLYIETDHQIVQVQRIL